jgi:predicted phage terminase large subunit-like protein
MSAPFDRQVHLDLMRTDFEYFLAVAFRIITPGVNLRWAWHLEAMAHALAQAAGGACLRLLITIPPRHLKSITVSVAYVAWMMGRNPALKFMVASYSGELANEHHRLFRRVVRSRDFKAAFPGFKTTRDADGEFKTTAGGERKAVSVGGATTGYGADYIIVDDLMKAGDVAHAALRDAAMDYFRGSLISRLNDADVGRIIVIAQRLHEDDVPGYCIDTGRYHHLNLPAIAEVRQVIALPRGRTRVREVGDTLYQDRATLDRLRDELGAQVFATQYQQDPTAVGGGLIRWDEIPRYDVPPPRHRLRKVVQSWDTAFSTGPGASYSVCSTWGFDDLGRWLLLDLARFRAEYAALKDRVRALRDQWKADVVLVENASSGQSLISELMFERRTQPQDRTSFPWRVEKRQPAQDKVSRWAACAALLTSGEVLLPREAPWLDDLRREVIGFPNSRYDDQVDSLSQFLIWTRERLGRALVRDHNERMEERRRQRQAAGIDEGEDDDADWFRRGRGR